MEITSSTHVLFMKLCDNFVHVLAHGAGGNELIGFLLIVIASVTKERSLESLFIELEKEHTTIKHDSGMEKLRKNMETMQTKHSMY